MSYILDALRRAEAERERGHVPGLHSQPLGAGAPQAAPPQRHRGWVLGLGFGAAALLLGALGWLLAGRPPAATPAVVAAAPAGAAVQAPAAAPAATPPDDGVPPPPKRLFPPAPLPPDPVVPKPPVVAAAPAPIVSSTPAPAAAAPAAPAPAAVALPAPPPPPARAPDRVLPFGQLPEDIRRQLPTLPIGGAIYSDNAASRMLIVGGQLLHEGDQAAPGIVLEQIKPKSAVLRWNNVRYEVTF